MSLVIKAGYGLLFIKLSSILHSSQVGIILSFDAIRILVDSLEEVTTRLEGKLSATGDKMMSIALHSKDAVQVSDREINSILSDTWTVIDTIHKFNTIVIKHLTSAFSFDEELTSEFNALNETLTGIRNMYQHLDEKFTDYFNNPDNTDCVYGGLNWLYRNDNYIIDCILKTGITPSRSYMDVNLTQETQNEFTELGVHDFTISYVQPIRKGWVNKQMTYDYKKVKLNISKLVECTNKVIIYLINGGINTLEIAAKRNNITVAQMIEGRSGPTIAIMKQEIGDTQMHLILADISVAHP